MKREIKKDVENLIKKHSIKTVSLWLGISQHDLSSWLTGETGREEDILHAYKNFNLIGVNDVYTTSHKELYDYINNTRNPGVYIILLRKNSGACEIVDYVTSQNNQFCLVKKITNLKKMVLSDSYRQKIVLNIQDNPHEHWKEIISLSEHKPIFVITEEEPENTMLNLWDQPIPVKYIEGLNRKDAELSLLSVFEQDVFPGNTLELIAYRINTSYPLLLQAIKTVKKRVEENIPVDESIIKDLRKENIDDFF